MFKRIFALVTSVALGASGCTTLKKSTLTGAGIGMGIGAGLGLLATGSENSRQRTQGALIGAAAIGLLGGLIGYQSYKDKEKKSQGQLVDVNGNKIEIFGNGVDDKNRPSLKPAQVRVRYVEDQIKDGTFVPAHFEYEISSPARWEKSK